MTNEEFLIWLAGCFDLGKPTVFSRHQLIVIQNHLNLVKEVDGCLNDENQLIAVNLETCLKSNSVEFPSHILFREVD